MILNSYAVLDGFVTLLRLGLGILVVYISAASLWRYYSGAGRPEIRWLAEERSNLLFLLAGLLLILNIASWPLLYLLLQSYVSQWPGIMCIYGVTRIGAGSVGPSRFLPLLLTALQTMKPALVFISGSWLVLHWINRQTRTAPLTGRVLFIIFAAGLFAISDAGAEAAYLFIPKKEQFPSYGCCAQAFDSISAANRFLPKAWIEEKDTPAVLTLYYAVNLAVIVTLGGSIWLRPSQRLGWRLLPLLALATASMIVSAVFLIDVAAPRLLHLPFHHCPYDLIPRAPESLLAIALYCAGCLAVGWACVADWMGVHFESEAILPNIVRGWLQLAFFAYLGSLLMITLELALV